MIEGHGDDAWKYTTPIKADFSSNVLYGPLDPGLLAHLQWALAAITHYPEAGAQSLQTAAEKTYGVSEGCVLATNGVTEAIYLIAQAFRRHTAVIYTPAFAEYEDACAVQGMNIAFHNWDELRRGHLPGDGLVFLCNPNNPTGWAVSLDRLGEYPDTLFVVDESYIDFAPSAVSVLGRGYPNVLVLRSLTKSCRIPGLRVGFVIGPELLVTRLRDCKMPWSVNRLAIEAGLYIFSHPEDFSVRAALLRTETKLWQEELRAVLEDRGATVGTALTRGDEAGTGWKVWDTDTHYFLIETPQDWPAYALKKRLIERHRLLVRDATNFRGLGANSIRVACQSFEHNRLLKLALAECVQIGR
jgi:threonine-phosphate decarboxylase